MVSPMKFITIFFFLFPLVLFGGKLTEEEIEYFLDVALNTENSAGRTGTIKKWEKDIKIKVHPDVTITPEDTANLTNTINTLNSLLNNTIAISIVEENQNIDFHFTDSSGLKEFGAGYIGGFALAWGASIHDATIGVDIFFGKSNDGSRRQDWTNHVATEELTQCLGLFADSRMFEDSIFHEDFTKQTTISNIDKKLINILYRPEVKVGMSEAQLYALLPTLEYDDGILATEEAEKPPSETTGTGWLWHDQWPWVYSAQKSGWLYFYPHGGKLYVYEVATRQWAPYSSLFGQL